MLGEQKGAGSQEESPHSWSAQGSTARNGAQHWQSPRELV